MKRTVQKYRFIYIRPPTRTTRSPPQKDYRKWTIVLSDTNLYQVLFVIYIYLFLNNEYLK